MKYFGHFFTSVVKSVFRIIGCFFGFYGKMELFFLFFIIAEVLGGILEELVDKR